MVHCMVVVLLLQVVRLFTHPIELSQPCMTTQCLPGCLSLAPPPPVPPAVKQVVIVPVTLP